MSKSMSSSKAARVQKICTLWTHDENFSKDDVVFNNEKFPELPDAPGTLLQIVAVSTGTAIRDFSSTPKVPTIDAGQVKAEAASKDATDSHSRKGRRGSFSKLFDENGSAGPHSHDVDTEKTYIFTSRPLPQDLKVKHANLQISIAEKVAKVFGFRNRMQVVLSEADESRHEAHHVELVFRDEYLARADMWRMAIAELSKRTVYRGQKVIFMGTIKATVKQIYIDGQSVHSGYFSPATKPIFRSESARYVLFIQMSREMWDFDAEGAGEIMFNKVVSGFLPDLFKRWLRINAKHVVTIIMFTRMQYDEEVSIDRPDSTTSRHDADSRTSSYRDYYRVVVSDMASGDWIKILHQLKLEFRTFLREVSLIARPTAESVGASSSDNESQHVDAGTIIAGKPSSASQGNILEAINLAAAQFAQDHIDRDLVRTGISVIVITPGTGVFEVDYNMLKLTTDTLIGSGIGIDLVCLSPMPLHSVPLFKYLSPSVVSKSAATQQRNLHALKRSASEPDEKTPKQKHPDFGATLHESSQTIDGRTPWTTDATNDWKFAMPYWVDISFWSRHSSDVLELSKTRLADRIVKRSHKKRRTFALRCRLYELQMMGVIENELGDIGLPYLEEEHSHPQVNLDNDTDTCRTNSSALVAASDTIGSFSSKGDREYMDSRKAAFKTWMEGYDNSIFCIQPRTRSSTQTQTSNDGNPVDPQPERSSGPLKDSFLSTSYRSHRTIVGRQIRSSPETISQQDNHARIRTNEKDSCRMKMDRLLNANSHGTPRADVLRRQNLVGHTTTDGVRTNMHRRGRSGDSNAKKKSAHATPDQSPAPSRMHSPSRRTGQTSLPATSKPMMVKEQLKPRPSNWFLRQISFGGKAAAALPTLGDATTDITQGSVKPAMLTVEKSQKGAIAERLASTRLASTEKPSQPITIRSSSRAGLSSNGSPSPDQGGRSVETVRDLRMRRTSTPSHPSSMKKDPGSTFLIAGKGEPKPNLDLSSSGGARDAPKTLSPTSAIAPWAVLVNPCNPKKNVMNSINQYRRWHHVFPRTLRTGTLKWRSLCSPAAVPLTHEWFPTAEQLSSEYNESPYKITQSDEEELVEAPRGRETLLRELVAFRLSHGFQICTGPAVAEFSGRQEKSLASILSPGYLASDGDTIFMTVGTSIHQLVCIAGGEVEVKRYHRKPTTALESSAGVDMPFPYRPYIRTAFEQTYDPRDIVLHPPRKEYNWNFIDTFLAGYQEEFSDILRFWRARFVLIPVEIPLVSRRPLPMLAEDSEEEVRLEGIRKLTQLWQRYRYFPPEERFSQGSSATKQKDPNPLAIEYHTRDPSAVVAAGPVNTLLNNSDSELPGPIFPDADKYTTPNIDLKKLAEDLQGEKGIQMLDRRWHWKLHYNCFLGFDLTTWLLNNFKDVDSREGAVDLGNQLMEKGLFQHVQRRHQFRDGNFFFQIAPEYRAPRPESRAGWFSLRKADKSIPSTPLAEGPKTSPLTGRSAMSRPSTADSSSNASDSVKEGEKTPTRAAAARRKFILSRAMRYDVDSRKRSYRPEIISLHYDLVHNPDNCYHIRIDWMNVTAKLIEDAIVNWATSVEKYGLKLVEVPIAELANITDYHPFRSPYHIKLAMQPPQNQPEAMWDSMQFSPQYARTDKFAYHKALLRKLNFVLDMEAASAFPPDVDVSYSWGNPDYKYTQFIHRSGGLLAQITDEGHFMVLANRLAHNRAKDMSRIRPLDLHEHKKVTTDGSSSSRIPSTPAMERANPHRSPFASPLARPVQDSSLLHTALEKQAAAQPGPIAWTTQTPEQIKDELEAFCGDPALLGQFYNEAFKQAPSPSPRIMPVLDHNIPSLGLPPAINIREASPANREWSLGSGVMMGRNSGAERIGGISDMAFNSTSGIAGRRQGSEGSMATLGKRGSIAESSGAGSLPKRQDSQGSTGTGAGTGTGTGTGV